MDEEDIRDARPDRFVLIRYVWMDTQHHAWLDDRIRILTDDRYIVINADTMAMPNPRIDIKMLRLLTDDSCQFRYFHTRLHRIPDRLHGGNTRFTDGFFFIGQFTDRKQTALFHPCAVRPDDFCERSDESRLTDCI